MVDQTIIIIFKNVNLSTLASTLGQIRRSGTGGLTVEVIKMLKVERVF